METGKTVTGDTEAGEAERQERLRDKGQTEMGETERKVRLRDM